MLRKLKIDQVDMDQLLLSRIEKRRQEILLNNINRKISRKEKTGDKNIKTECSTKDIILTDIKFQEDTLDIIKTSIKTKHNVVNNTYAEEVLDISRGVFILREEAETKLQGKPPIETKHIIISDKDCDTYVASYIASCIANDKAVDLRRQIEDYKKAHPPLFRLGEPPPVDPDYETLKVKLTNEEDIVKNEMNIQNEIVQRTLGTEKVGYYMRINIATGEIVLGDKPEE